MLFDFQMQKWTELAKGVFVWLPELVEGRTIRLRFGFQGKGRGSQNSNQRP